MLQAFTALLQPQDATPRANKRSKRSKRHSPPLRQQISRPKTDSPNTMTMDTTPAVDAPLAVPLQLPMEVESPSNTLHDMITSSQQHTAMQETESSPSDSDSDTSFTGSSHSTGDTNETFNVYDQNGLRRTVENDNLLLIDPLYTASTDRRSNETMPDLFYGSDDITPQQVHNTTSRLHQPDQPSQFSKHPTLPRHSLSGRGGRGGRSRRDAHRTKANPDHSTDEQSQATVLAMDDHSITTTASTVHDQQQLQDDPAPDPNQSESLGTPRQSRKKYRAIPASSIHEAMASESARHTAQSPESSSPAFSLETPWQVVNSSYKRKIKAETSQSTTLANLIRKPHPTGQTPKKIFLQPATPQQEAPAPKK
jgi:hypothetical protein